MKRIILHWTAGADGVTPLEQDHYNFIIGRDGTVTNGKFPPEAQTADNVRRGSGFYAAHTLNCNTDSIGVSLDAMAGAVERPFTTGPYPITEIQLAAMAKLVADLCIKYRILVSKSTVLSHAEVQPTLGIAQRQKWDISWIPGMDAPGDPVAVGAVLRRMISNEVANRAISPKKVSEPYVRPTVRLYSVDKATVTIAQNALIEAGYLSGKNDEKANGIFGNLTFFAVKAFQKDKGLTTDGVIGPKTWAQLEGFIE